MQPHQRQAVAALLADDQRDMFAQVGGERKATISASSQAETGRRARVTMRSAQRRNRRQDRTRRPAPPRPRPPDRPESGQDPGNPRQFQRGAGGFLPVQRHRLERAFQAGCQDRAPDRQSAGHRAKVKSSPPAISTGACGTAASRWLASFSVAARAAEISIRGALAPWAMAVSTGSRSRPAAPNASGQPWRRASTACAARRSGDRRAQRSNSVISGT
jgi:hypothetical protein